MTYTIKIVNGHHIVGMSADEFFRKLDISIKKLSDEDLSELIKDLRDFKNSRLKENHRRLK